VNAFQRVWNGLFGSLEDPSQLAVFVDELDRHVRDLHRAVARAIADGKRQKAEIGVHMARAAGWEARAVLARRDGDEALAREALLKKAQCEAYALTLRKSRETQREAARKLTASLRAERVRVEDAKSRYSALLAPCHSAVIEELNDRICQIEAELDAD
jgi:phage shock protein A